MMPAIKTQTIKRSINECNKNFEAEQPLLDTYKLVGLFLELHRWLEVFKDVIRCNKSNYAKWKITLFQQSTVNVIRNCGDKLKVTLKPLAQVPTMVFESLCFLQLNHNYCCSIFSYAATRCIHKACHVAAALWTCWHDFSCIYLTAIYWKWSEVTTCKHTHTHAICAQHPQLG